MKVFTLLKRDDMNQQIVTLIIVAGLLWFWQRGKSAASSGVGSLPVIPPLSTSSGVGVDAPAPAYGSSPGLTDSSGISDLPETGGSTMDQNLVELANRYNTAVSTLRSNGVLQQYISAVHVIGPFGGDTAIEIKLGGTAMRKQLADFSSEVDSQEYNASMTLHYTDAQRASMQQAGITTLPISDITVTVY
jgi:hypothetical protein